MRPPTASASSAAGSARSSAPSSPLTSMRSAWKVRLAGLPPVRRVAAGIASRTRSTSAGRCVNGSRSRARDDRGRRCGGRTAPRRSRAAPGPARRRVGVDDVGRGEPGRRVHPHVQRRVLGVGEAALGLVELQRGDAEVEQDRLDPARARAGAGPRAARRRRRAPASSRSRERRPGARGTARSASGSRSRPTSRSSGNAAQHRLAVATEAERGVDEDGAAPVRAGASSASTGRA